MMLQLNKIYCGDCLKGMKYIDDESIDLIYVDPPFFSNVDYGIIFKDNKKRKYAFGDKFESIDDYIDFMRKRVFEFHRVLKDTGSFYLHCDWHASHYLKVMCDDIFGYNKFQNEIVWHYKTGGLSKKRFARKHDILLFYLKDNKKYLFNTLKEKAYIPTLKGRTFAKEKLGAEIDNEGCNICGQKGGFYHMSSLTDVWIIPALFRNNKERLGYPTQKPEILLERIIKASSNKEDLVLDPFCGCGTTIAVAQRLQRKWIGIDVSPSACKLMKNRVEKNGARGIEIIGLPLNVTELKELPPFEFQNWCIGALGGTVNPKKVGDMGIDGFTFMHRYPIQVKQSEGIGRNVIDNFETALQRAKQDMGYIIAFSFGKGAYEEVAEAKQRGLHIDLLTVDKLLEYEEPAGQGKMF